MRSFNANFIIEKNKRADGPAPINLLTFGFSTPVYLSDRDITPSGGSAHAGLIKDWGFIDSSVIHTPGSGVLGTIQICDLQLVIINTEALSFSDNFTITDPPENVTVELYQWFFGLLYSEKEIIFKGTIAGQPKYDEHECRLTVRGIFEKYNKMIGEDAIVNVDDYPGADPDDIGKMLCLGYGDLKNVPFRAVDAGGLTTIISDITASSPGNGGTLEVSDGSYLPAGVHTIQTDLEKIRIASRSGNILTLAASGARGYGGTDAVAHNAGVFCAEIQTEYFYIYSRAIKSFGAIKVDDIRQDGNYTAYTGQSGDEHASYPGKACIKFTTLPSLIKQVNVEVDDTIDVNDTIAFSHAGQRICHSTDADIGDEYNIAAGMHSLNSTIYYNVSHWSPDYAINTSENGYSIKWTFSINVLDYGTAGYMHILVRDMSDNTDRLMFKIDAGVVTTNLNPRTFYLSSPNDDPSHNGVATVASNAAWDGHVMVTLVDVELTFNEYPISSDKTGAASKTGSASLSGNSVADTVIGMKVTADIEAEQDDGAGTYTGTPNALIERPDHIFKHIWSEILGAPAGDIDTPTFNVAGTFFATNSYKFSLLISKPIRAEDLLMKLALQCRSRFFVSPHGKAKLIVRQLDQASGHAIAKNEIKRGSMSIQRSSTDDLINFFNIWYDLDHSKESNNTKDCQAVKPFSDATSITRYGQHEWTGAKNLFLFDAVTDTAMIVHVGAFLLDYHKLVRNGPDFAVFLDNMETEPGDIIDITHSLDSMDSFACEVLKIMHTLGSAKSNVIDHIKMIAVDNSS